ncbi:DUF1800 domain-containing protein [Derxia lacustris]|uniref:DUF1800 domain-containing protein n=1 Tax=Derxia lacustris TaxID=764842 RepID=UPI000A17862F|nr:DUF1800 family protein [Derxia lacustris]
MHRLQGAAHGAGPARRWIAALCLALAACGGGGGGGGNSATPVTGAAAVAAAADRPTTSLDAARLAEQASFGPTESLIAGIAASGPLKWIARQMTLPASSYPQLGSEAIDRWTDKNRSWCQANFSAGTYCWRDYYTATPVAWQFYRQALGNDDQLRQRVAWALSQWLVASDQEVNGTYGLRHWAQLFRDNAFGNYRDLLRAVALSPVMGEFLNNVNNSKTDPNENFARELLQLFSIGTCVLNHDGSLKDGKCEATYDNATVREYAYALTGWTYPAGGASAWCASLCNGWQNPRWLSGAMVAVPAQHDQTVRTLLSGVTLPASRTPEQALDKVLDSIMAHGNLAPFVARRLIQHLVTGNPSAAYVADVASAFEAGSYQGIGSGTRGDLGATVAAVLLHAEARDTAHLTDRGYGRLREPVQLWTGVMRALDAVSDGLWWASAFGGELDQAIYGAPSVFSYYAPDYIPGGADVTAPAFGIEDANTTLKRLSFINYLSFTKSDPVMPASATVAGAIGTALSWSRYADSAGDPAALVDRLDLLLTSRQLNATQKQAIVDAVSVINQSTHGADWPAWRVRAAVFLTLAAPQSSIVR